MSRADSSTTLATASIAAASPALGDYGVILLAALLGAAVSLSRLELGGRRDALRYLFRAVSISAVLSSGAAAWLSSVLALDASLLLAPVAFLIAVVGDGWFAVRDRLLSMIGRRSPP